MFGRLQQTSRDEVFSALKRTFHTLDNEILEQARTSGAADCQFGGTTALMVLQSGHVRLYNPPCIYPVISKVSAAATNCVYAFSILLSFHKRSCLISSG